MAFHTKTAGKLDKIFTDSRKVKFMGDMLDMETKNENIDAMIEALEKLSKINLDMYLDTQFTIRELKEYYYNK